jgi:hypothetical protein
MAKIVIIGSAHPFRGGGVTTFNHRLAKEFIDLGHECAIYSFSLQYPSFLFPGKHNIPMNLRRMAYHSFRD